MKRKARVRKKKPPRRRAADTGIIEELKDQLSDDHLRGLLDGSGIAAEVVADRGYRTATSKAQLRRLGFSDHQCNVPALIMPFHDIDGEIRTYHLRPDRPRIGKNGRPTKYEMPQGSRMTLDVHPWIHQKGWLRDPRRRLFVTEGIKKADSAVSRALCCVALAGTWCWRGANEQGGKTALADWESIALNERDVYIVFDSDVMTKSSVYGALVRLKGFLERRGARVTFPRFGGHGVK